MGFRSLIGGLGTNLVLLHHEWSVTPSEVFEVVRCVTWAWYPPFIAAGIRVPVCDPAGGVYKAHMRLSFYNRNALGTHFGGSLYSMCDPFYALILVEQLGRGYEVWDKAAAIEFLRPGRGKVSAIFEIPPEKVEEIRSAAESGDVVEPVFVAEVTDEYGSVVARVTKTIHVEEEDAAGVVGRVGLGLRPLVPEVRVERRCGCYGH